MDFMGEIIFDIREVEGIAQNVLCEGICSASTLSRLEWEGRNISQWLIDALLQRLGKSQDSFWSIISISDYRLLEQRENIWNDILCGDYEEARSGLIAYEKRVKVNNNNVQVHMQFVQKCWGVLAGREENNWEEAIKLLTSAITYTVTGFKIEKVKDDLLGRNEMMVILLLAEAYEKIGSSEISEQLLTGLMENMEYKIWEEEEKVKIYPKIVCRYIEVLKREDKYEEVIALSKKATDLLVENGVVFLLSELMECTIWGILRRSEIEERRYSVAEEQELNQLTKDVTILTQLWRQYGNLPVEEMIYCTNTQKDISISNEIIFKCRKLCHLSQEQLSERVCTVENLSRIENFKCSPMDRSYRALMEKMDQSQERNRYIVNAEEYALHEKVRRIEKYISRMEYRKAAAEWDRLRDQIPIDSLSNQQCISRYDTIINYYNKEITVEQAFEDYEAALRITMPDYPDVDVVNWPLSRNEIFLLSNIAELYKTQGQIDKTVKIYDKLCQFFEKSMVDTLYRSVEYCMVLYNMSIALVEMEQHKKAFEVIEKGIECCIRCGRFNMMPHFLLIKGGEYVGDNSDKNDQKARNILKQAFWLSNILRMPSMSSHISDHYKENWNEDIK